MSLAPSIEGSSDSDPITFVGSVSKSSVPVILFFLNLEYKSHDDEVLELEYVSPNVNIRSVSLGRALEEFKPEVSHDTTIYGAICARPKIHEDGFILGLNILYSEENDSASFDFEIIDKDLLHFYLIATAPPAGYLDGEVKIKTDHFEELLQENRQLHEGGTHNLFKVIFDLFRQRYSDFQTKQSFEDLIEVLDDYGENMNVPYEVRRNNDIFLFRISSWTVIAKTFCYEFFVLTFTGSFGVE